MDPPKTSKVFLISASDRINGIETLLNQFNIDTFTDSTVAIKANYNSADPFPATTHIDTLRTLVQSLNEQKPREITLAERSGMGTTFKVLERMMVLHLSKKLGFRVIDLDEILPQGWEYIPPNGLHWKRGFKIARLFREADKVIQTCCLKTHRYGGHFTMSLKNSVGLIAKQLRGESYNYMGELHSSPYQRLMIGEINKFYPVHIIVMDATEGFSNGGPESGTLIRPNLLLASNDRVAMDAVGVAILRHYGSTLDVMRGSIFNQDQIARAAELGVGIATASGVHLVSLDEGSTGIRNEIQKILNS